MLGALLGDIVGSRYEFNNNRTKEFPLFSKGCFMTDDSIMTLAVAEILQNNYQYDEDKVIETFRKWGRAYPNRGYGGRFRVWLNSNAKYSNSSYGNGAAMRISPVGWYARNEEEVKEFSRLVTKVSHNHPEGLKGAEVVAMCIYYARIGKTKEFIKKYVEQYYDLNFDYEWLKKNYWFNETCQDTVPQAIYCFLISNSTIDCVRTTISIGGDCDTTAAIAGSIAEAYYKDLDFETEEKIMKYLPNSVDGCEPLKITKKFYEEQLTVNTLCEEITEETRFIFESNIENNQLNGSWIFSKSKIVLVKSMIYDLFDYLPVFEKSKMFFIKPEKSNDFMEKEALIPILINMKSLFNSMINCDSQQSFIKYFDSFKNLLSLADNHKQASYFDNKNTSMEYIFENFEGNKQDIKEIFLKNYKKEC